jgi:hypothetical protein
MIFVVDAIVANELCLNGALRILKRLAGFSMVSGDDCLKDNEKSHTVQSLEE